MNPVLSSLLSLFAESSVYVELVTLRANCAAVVTRYSSRTFPFNIIIVTPHYFSLFTSNQYIFLPFPSLFRLMFPQIQFFIISN